MVIKLISVKRLNQSGLPMHMLQAQNDFSRIEFHFIFIENSVLKNAIFRIENPKVWLVLIVEINLDGSEERRAKSFN